MIFKNTFREKVENKKFTISLEINPNKKGDLQKNFQEIALCAPFLDAIDVTDSSMARLTPSSFIVASEIQRKFDIPTIFNFTCRDRNILGIKSDLMGALILGIENIICLTGDPPVHGDHPNTKPVYEINSSGLLALCNNLSTVNHKFFTGGVLNFNDNKKVMEKMCEIKKSAGAKFIITQPVYTKNRIDFLQKLQEKFSLPIIVGILPIKSWRIAKYMQEKVVGITIPVEQYEKMEKLSDSDILQFQIENASTLYNYAKKLKLSGVHFMPLGQGDKIPQIIKNDSK